MADNTTLPGTGDVIAADDIAGVKYQIVKHAFGPLDTATLVQTGVGLPVADASVASVTKQKNSASSVTDYGQVILAQRRDSDTAETTADGQYTPLKQDQAGRLKVATQPGDVTATSGSITAAAQTVFILTTRISTISISMVATSLVGHNAIFEISNDSTDGSNGNWKTVQAVRTDSNIIETTTGVLAATPAYAWELNVAAYQYFRVRATAHTSGTAAYTIKPAAYATEPVPSSQNPALVASTYNVAGVIAINTTLLTIDCLNYKSLSVQCTSMGTAGVVTPQWSNDGTTWITATMLSEAGATSTTFNAAVLRNTNVIARYFRLQLTTATTAGTTTITVQASQAALPPIVTTQPVSGTVTATVTGGTVVGVAPTTTNAILSSAATTNGTVAKATAGTIYAIVCSNTGAAAAFVKLHNSATVTVGTTAVALTIPVPAGGVVQLDFGAQGMRYSTGICYSITNLAADTDTTAVAANQVKINLSYI